MMLGIIFQPSQDEQLLYLQSFCIIQPFCFSLSAQYPSHYKIIQYLTVKIVGFALDDFYKTVG